MPQPTIPTTMRSDGAGWSSLPRALAGMMVGAATAAAVAAINRRREILGADGEVFIAKNFGRSAFRARVENPSMPGAGRILVVHRQWAGGAMERGARKPHELAAGTAALRSAGLRPASSGGFQPPVLVVPSRCAPRSGQDAFKNGAGTAASARFVFAATLTPPLSVPEILEADGEGKILGANSRHDRLQFVLALARHANFFALNLGRDLELPLADEAGDLFGHGSLDALFDFDDLPCMAEWRKVRLAFVHILEADAAFRQLADDDFHERL